VIRALALASLLSAQTPGAPLTPDDVVKIALEKSGALSAARLGAEEKALERGLELDPLELRLGHRSVDGLFGDPHTDNDGTPYSPLDDAYVALRWGLPSPTDFARQWADEAEAQADDLDVQDLARETAAMARTLHARVLRLREEEALVRRAADVAAQLEVQTRERVAAQAGTDLDVHLASLDRLDAASDVEDVSNQARSAENRLAALLGLSSPLQLAPGPELCVDNTGKVDELIARASERSIRLRALEARKEKAHVEASSSWLRFVPSVDGVLVGWYNEPLDKRDSVRFLLDVGLPIFEPLSGRARAAQLQEMRMDALVVAERRDIDADVRSAAERLKNAVALVRLYEEGQRSVVDAGLADVGKALEAGQADVLRLTEVQSRMVKAQRGLLHARLRCEEAAIELQRVTGTL
jgi:outer membrane protein TolC